MKRGVWRQVVRDELGGAARTVAPPDPPPAYRQLSRDAGKCWVDIQGANGAYLNITVEKREGHDGNQYRCLVSDGLSEPVMSKPTVLSVGPASAEEIHTSNSPLREK